jgi:hypothetical protein
MAGSSKCVLQESMRPNSQLALQTKVGRIKAGARIHFGSFIGICFDKRFGLLSLWRKTGMADTSFGFTHQPPRHNPNRSLG